MLFLAIGIFAASMAQATAVGATLAILKMEQETLPKRSDTIKI